MDNVDEKDFWKKARQLAGKLPFVKDAAAMYFAMIDPQTPLASKLTIAGALAYFVSPIDAIPDFMPVLGYADDAAIIAGALAVVGAQVTDEHRKRASEMFG